MAISQRKGKVLGIAFITAGIIGLISSVVGNHFIHTRQDTITSKVNQLYVDSNVLPIEIKSSTSDLVSVELSSEDQYQLDIQQNGDHLRVKVKNKGWWYSLIRNRKLSIAPPVLTIQLPAAVQEVSVRSRESIQFERLNVRRINWDTVSGAIKGNELIANEIGLHSNSGKIQIEKLEGMNADIETDSGAISLNGVTVKESIDVESNSGAVVLGLTSLSGTIKAKSDTGQVSLPEVLPGGDRPSIKVETDSGSITVR